MANKTVKLLINEKAFPMLYSQAGRPTVDMEDIAPRMPGNFYGNSVNADFGSPQLIFCENVLPFAKGLYSVGYVQQVADISPAFSQCDQFITLRDASENLFGFIPARGANYVLNQATGLWSSVSTLTFTEDLVTRAYVNGRTFVCYSKTRIIEYNSGTGLFTTIALTYPAGLDITKVRGIGASSNYLLLFTDLTIYWCSPLDILNFADIDAGAGNQVPIDIQGMITSIMPISGGFIVYTGRNAVGATFTNNAQGPFIFRGITNCGGVSSWEKVTPAADNVGHYIWSSAGLQLVNLNTAQDIFPQVTDFLVAKQIERWNSTSKTVDTSTMTTALSVKMTFVANRFLVISYGLVPNSYEYALVYDTALERWGKLKINHVDVFDYPYSSGGGSPFTYDTLKGYYSDLVLDYFGLGIFSIAVTPASAGIAFLTNTGSIQILQTDYQQTSAPGVAIFGHIQQRHRYMITPINIAFDGLKDSPTPAVNVLKSSTGYVRDGVVAAYYDGSESFSDYKLYKVRTTARNFDIAVEGTFVLSSVLTNIVQNGYR